MYLSTQVLYIVAIITLFHFSLLFRRYDSVYACGRGGMTAGYIESHHKSWIARESHNLHLCPGAHPLSTPFHFQSYPVRMIKYMVILFIERMQWHKAKRTNPRTEFEFCLYQFPIRWPWQVLSP